MEQKRGPRNEPTLAKIKNSKHLLVLNREGDIRVKTGSPHSVIKTHTRAGIPAMPLTSFVSLGKLINP